MNAFQSSYILDFKKDQPFYTNVLLLKNISYWKRKFIRNFMRNINVNLHTLKKMKKRYANLTWILFFQSFITSVGSRDRRVRLALEHMCAPVIHGVCTALLAVAMLAFSDFEFIFRYFFLVLLCVIGIGSMNGLFFFPILLSLIGPAAEVVPNEHPDRMSTPTPPASPIVRRPKPPQPPRRSHKIDARLQAEPSLTTITEEPNSWVSNQESCIIVQPELKVETTSTCGNQVCIRLLFRFSFIFIPIKISKQRVQSMFL